MMLAHGFAPPRSASSQNRSSRLRLRRSLPKTTCIRGGNFRFPYPSPRSTSRPPRSAHHPGGPLLRGDRDDVRQVDLPRPAALTHLNQALTRGLADRALGELAAAPRPRRNGAQSERAEPALAHLIADDPQAGELAERKAPGEGRGERPAVGQPSAALDGCGTHGRPLGLAEGEDALPAEKSVLGLRSGLEDGFAGVDLLGETLGILVAEGASREPLPDRAGEVVEAVQRARGINRARNVGCEHRQPSRAACAVKASSLGELAFPVDSLAGA